MLYCIFFSNSEISQSGHEIEVHSLKHTVSYVMLL